MKNLPASCSASTAISAEYFCGWSNISAVLVANVAGSDGAENSCAQTQRTEPPHPHLRSNTAAAAAWPAPCATAPARGNDSHPQQEVPRASLPETLPDRDSAAPPI